MKIRHGAQAAVLVFAGWASLLAIVPCARAEVPEPGCVFQAKFDALYGTQLVLCVEEMHDPCSSALPCLVPRGTVSAIPC